MGIEFISFPSGQSCCCDPCPPPCLSGNIEACSSVTYALTSINWYPGKVGCTESPFVNNAPCVPNCGIFPKAGFQLDLASRNFCSRFSVGFAHIPGTCTWSGTYGIMDYDGTTAQITLYNTGGTFGCAGSKTLTFGSVHPFSGVSTGSYHLDCLFNSGERNVYPSGNNCPTWETDVCTQLFPVSADAPRKCGVCFDCTSGNCIMPTGFIFNWNDIPNISQEWPAVHRHFCCGNTAGPDHAVCNLTGKSSILGRTAIPNCGYQATEPCPGICCGYGRELILFVGATPAQSYFTVNLSQTFSFATTYQRIVHNITPVMPDCKDFTLSFLYGVEWTTFRPVPQPLPWSTVAALDGITLIGLMPP